MNIVTSVILYVESEDLTNVLVCRIKEDGEPGTCGFWFSHTRPEQGVQLDGYRCSTELWGYEFGQRSANMF